MRMTTPLPMESPSDTDMHCSQPTLSPPGERCQLQQVAVPHCCSAMPLLHALEALHTKPAFSLQLQIFCEVRVLPSLSCQSLQLKAG